jgi:DNA polymerase I
VYIALDRAPGGAVRATEVDPDGARGSEHPVAAGGLPDFVRSREPERPRWTWLGTASWYPALLDAGLRVERCHDLALCERILASSELTLESELHRRPLPAWAALAVDEPDGDTLFAFDDYPEEGVSAAAALVAQLEAVRDTTQPGRLRLLLAAESAGALVAAEMRYAGLPWRGDVHDRLLSELLGPRVPTGQRPERLEELARSVRTLLDAPELNPDSQQELLRALRRAGLIVASTRAWELRELVHPAIEPLLEYKKLSRLLAANGWAWRDAWIKDGRFHPDYVPGGVVSGRWATRGGGALQLPKQVRSAVVADPGWKLVVADAAQLEPRVLAGLAADTAMAAAGRGSDLYDGLVAARVVETRARAKVAMLGAMYGATTGDSAVLVPRLARAYPRAIGVVEAAARSGERGEVVTSRLGRTSPPPGAEWAETQSRAAAPEASPADERRARSRARDWGRFTRNFVVQASAAEWALCWLAEIRRRLMHAAAPSERATTEGLAREPFRTEPHLVFFLHDEVVVHAPADQADRVAEVVRDSARRAGELLFGDFAVEFPLSVAIVDDYGQAKQ